jgi:transcription initiation factor TFIIIB Brf1 subunit/transcription initiation factor TFIIB
MRSILVDWLIEVHLAFKMNISTLYLAVSLIDRYLEKNKSCRESLQLVGISALFTASKIEDIYPPPLSDFVAVTDNSVDKKQILDMESKIVTSLNFSFTVPYPLDFLTKYAEELGVC